MNLPYPYFFKLLPYFRNVTLEWRTENILIVMLILIDKKLRGLLKTSEYFVEDNIEEQKYLKCKSLDTLNPL